MANPEAEQTKKTTKTAESPDIKRDIAVLKIEFDLAVQNMNARRERFPHPMGARIGGIIGNNLYKYHNDSSLLAAPAGPLLSRLYPGYEKIKECYDQAITVLEQVKRTEHHLNTPWEYGIASHPGHYWACMKSKLGEVFVHMDPWLESFKVTAVLDDSLIYAVSWQAWH